MKVLLIGATGLIGKNCLKQLLLDPKVDTVEIWTRKELSASHPKLKQKLIDFSELSIQDPGKTDAILCCIGSTIKKSGSQEKFRQIDYQYVVELSIIAERANVQKLIIVSSVGANAKSRNFYLKTKGEMEEKVCKAMIPTIVFLRPSMLLGTREEFRFGELIGQKLMKVFGFLFVGKLKRYKAIDAETVTTAMIALTKENNESTIFIESEQIEQHRKP